MDVVADDARFVEFLGHYHSPGVGVPHTRAKGQDLYELRQGGRSGAGRALSCFVHDRRIVIVHAFLKKTRTTPGRDLAITRQRAKETKRG